MVNLNNAAGHRERYAQVVKLTKGVDAGAYYVSGGHPEGFYKTGFEAREILARYHPLSQASVIDVGCGAGRLTQYLATAGVRSYLGTDVVPEVLEEARSRGRPDFDYVLVDGPVIPSPPESADIVCAFSVITHLTDHETLRLFREARAAMKAKGVAIFSYLDFEQNGPIFAHYANTYEANPALLKFFEHETLRRFAGMAGFEIVEVLRIGATLPVAQKGDTYLDGTPAPPEFKLGHNMFVVRKP